MGAIIQEKINENVVELSIIKSIREIRGKKVILDFELADLYEVETRRLNEQVKRNSRRFPDDFMFQLTNQEFKILKSQIATSSWGGTRKLPYAFTEQGIAMLSGLLNSDIAIDTNILIMRTFVAIRQYVLSYAELKKELEEYIHKNDINIDKIFKVLDILIAKKQELEKPRTQIGFKTKGGK